MNRSRRGYGHFLVNLCLMGRCRGVGKFSLFLLAAVACSSSVLCSVALAADPSAGSRIYIKHCQSCHGADGKASFPGAPDFSRGEKLMQPDYLILNTIKKGLGIMPAYEGLYSDEELLDVIAYLRTLR